MGRVIKTDSTGKQRNQLMRTCAEILRHLSQKQDVDDEVRDMVATLVFSLRQIDDGIDRSIEAWEKRDYWIKAEQFRTRWTWVSLAADQLTAMIRSDDWQQLPAIIMRLYPHFADIKITKLTRKPSTWAGSYARLLREQPDLA